MPFTDWPKSSAAHHGHDNDRRRHKSSLRGVIRECTLWTVALTIVIGAFAFSWRPVPL